MSSPTRTPTRTPWDQGFDIGYNGGEIDENLYLPGTTDHEDWIAGFYAGLSVEEEDGS